MTGSLWQRLDQLARLVMPFIITELLVLIGLVPIKFPGHMALSPAFAMMSIYYWALIRPSLLPGPAVFAIGLLQDMLTGAPAGSGAFLLLLAYGMTVSQRRFFHAKSFGVMWGGFLAVSAVAGLAQWLLLSALSGMLLPAGPVMTQLLLTVALFPVLAWVLIYTHRALARGEEP